VCGFVIIKKGEIDGSFGVLMCDKLTKYLIYILECVLAEQVDDDTSVRMDRLRRLGQAGAWTKQQVRVCGSRRARAEEDCGARSCLEEKREKIM
jgi:hypothetical protein